MKRMIITASLVIAMTSMTAFACGGCGCTTKAETKTEQGATKKGAAETVAVEVADSEESVKKCDKSKKKCDKSVKSEKKCDKSEKRAEKKCDKSEKKSEKHGEKSCDSKSGSDHSSH